MQEKRRTQKKQFQLGSFSVSSTSRSAKKEEEACLKLDLTGKKWRTGMSPCHVLPLDDDEPGKHHRMEVDTVYPLLHPDSTSHKTICSFQNNLI